MDSLVEQKVEEVWSRGKQAVAQAERRQRETTERIKQELELFRKQQDEMKATNEHLMQFMVSVLGQFSAVDAADLAVQFSQPSVPPAPTNNGSECFMHPFADGAAASCVWPPMSTTCPLPATPAPTTAAKVLPSPSLEPPPPTSAPTTPTGLPTTPMQPVSIISPTPLPLAPTISQLLPPPPPMAAPPSVVAPALPPTPPVPEAPAVVPKVAESIADTDNPSLSIAPPQSQPIRTLSLAGRLPPPALTPTPQSSPQGSPKASPQASPQACERTPLSIAAALLGHNDVPFMQVGAWQFASAAEMRLNGADSEIFCV
jgi:hypothetical protein